jgi:protein phosphatase
MSASGDQEARSTDEYLTLDEVVSRFYETEPRLRARVELAAYSHPGLVRPQNEDQYLAVRRYRGRQVLATSVPEEILERAEDHAYTLLVADGMGGHRFGMLASLLALLTGWTLGAGEIKWSVRMNEREEDELREKAEVFFRLIHRALLAEGRQYPRLAGMGTTLTVCYTIGPELFVMHAGDSRAYVHRAGALRRLTRDHTMGQALIDAGLAEPDSPDVMRVRHVLTNCLGGPELEVEVEFRHERMADGDRLLLCTDGLTDLVSDDEIVRVLDERPVLYEACRALVDLALERGGKDNVTVMVARYHFDEPGPDRVTIRPA